MINLSLDKHDFLYCVEGFARGSHLRQHVWEYIVFRNISQMDKDDMNFFWYYFRRNLWDGYFMTLRGGIRSHTCGDRDYLQALAALHLGNRYRVTFHSAQNKRDYTVVCYRFDGRYHVLGCPDQPSGVICFSSYVSPDEIKKIVHLPFEDNPYIPVNHRSWWTDDPDMIYDKADEFIREFIQIP